VSTTTFGVGRGFNENLLELIATNGGGNYYFIDRPEIIPEIFQMELDELSTVTSADTEIKFSIPANVTLDVVGAWKSKKTAKRLLVHLGEIPGGQERILFLKMVCPPKARREGLEIKAGVTGIDEDGKLMKTNETISFEYADRELVLNERVNLEVMYSAASVFMAQAAREAHLLERRGRFKEAQSLLNAALAEYGRYLSRADQARYQDISQRIEFGLNPMAAKKMHYDAHIGTRSIKRRIPDEKIR
jgi:Ca-activated chloride channel family protein